MLSNQLSENKKRFSLGDKIKLRPSTIKLSRTGLTFLEIVIALIILSVALVGFLEIFNTALNATYRATRESIATNLASGLLAEVMSKNFEEPGSGSPPPALGPDPPALPTESRFGGVLLTPYDDVDDYNGYNETPPRTLGNLPMDGLGNPPRPDYSDFTRSVAVKYVNFLSDGTYVENPAGNTNYKEVTVTVIGASYTRSVTNVGIKVKLP